MSSLELLFTANIVVWAGICGYILFLGGRTRQIRRRMQQLESVRDEQQARL
jgi:CcmD family protein